MSAITKKCALKLFSIHSRRAASSKAYSNPEFTNGKESESSTTDTALVTLAPSDVASPDSSAASSYYQSLISYWSLAYNRLYGVQKTEVPIVNKRRKPSRSEVVAETRVLVERLLSAKSDSQVFSDITQLNKQLASFPSCKEAAIQFKHKNGSSLTSFLAERAENSNLRDVSMQCMELCGYIQPPKSRGIRILSIDGGGTRGVMALECLGALESRSGGKKMHEMFDLIVGVSTGAIIATLVGAKKMSVREALNTYTDVSKKLFNYGIFGRYLYTKKNSQLFEKILKEEIGENFSLLDSSGAPKLAIVSCIVNIHPLMPFLFRNYEHPPPNSSHFRGSTKYKFWEALLASSAAPTYFKEVVLDNFVHQDGGVLINNPTAIALHEARQLWPEERLQCVISVGNGKVLAKVDPEPEPYSWTSSFGVMVDSATETETTHYCISDLMPTNVYFRFNPYTSQEVYPLDTNEPDLIEQMRRDAKLYVRRNREKFDAAAAQLEMDSLKDKYAFLARLLRNSRERELLWRRASKWMVQQYTKLIVKRIANTT